MSGGSVGSSFSAFDGSAVNISGGTVGGYFRAFFGSAINISGGSIENGFYADNGTVVSINGGYMWGQFSARDGSSVELVGGEFKLNGEAFTGPNITFGDMMYLQGRWLMAPRLFSMKWVTTNSMA